MTVAPFQPGVCNPKSTPIQCPPTYSDIEGALVLRGQESTVLLSSWQRSGEKDGTRNHRGVPSNNGNVLAWY